MNTMNTPKAVDMWKTLRVSHIPTAPTATAILCLRSYKQKEEEEEEEEDISNGLNQRTFLSGLDRLLLSAYGQFLTPYGKFQVLAYQYS